MREGLLALAAGAGLQAMTAMLSADVSALAGPMGKYNSDRTGVRHGLERGRSRWAVGGCRCSGGGCARPTLW